MSKWPNFTAPEATAIQGMVVSGYPMLPCSRVLFVDFGSSDRGAARAWLGGVEALVADADKTEARGRTTATHIALSYAGVCHLRDDLTDTELDGFDPCFREGMTNRLRWRALHDDDPGALVKNGLKWRGTPPADDPLEGQAALVTVHALVLLYAVDCPAVEAAEAALPPLAKGMSEVRRLDTSLAERTFHHPDATASEPVPAFREHFGFVDGISQPVPHGEIPPTKSGPDDVAPGDLLLGHSNAYNERRPGPLIASERRGADRLPAWKDTPGFGALGYNGSYLVARELCQEVFGFWTSMAAEAARLRGLGHTQATCLWLAEKAIGRAIDGDMLRPESGAADTGFAAHDYHGLGCPLGSHVRRANPRDSAAREGGGEAARAEVLDSVNNHRILRRGRSFGVPLDHVPETDDGEHRGLMFLALNTDIARQFEFIMRTWLLNPAFAARADELDPILGSQSPFSIPRDPVRLRAKLERYVRLAGGDYYFLPSRPALQFLAA